MIINCHSLCSYQKMITNSVSFKNTAPKLRKSFLLTNNLVIFLLFLRKKVIMEIYTLFFVTTVPLHIRQKQVVPSTLVHDQYPLFLTPLIVSALLLLSEELFPLLWQQSGRSSSCGATPFQRLFLHSFFYTLYLLYTKNTIFLHQKICKFILHSIVDTL